MLLLDCLTTVVINQVAVGCIWHDCALHMVTAATQMDQRPSVSVNMTGELPRARPTDVSRLPTGQYQGAAKLGEELTIDCRLEKARL